MKKLVIFDLMGTLLEAEHVGKPNIGYRKNEYNSRIMYCTRKLNELLKRGMEIVILSSLDHTKLEHEMKIVSDIDSLIDKKYSNNLQYIFAKGGAVNVRNITSLSIDSNKPILIVEDKDSAYDYLIKKYYDYNIFAVDDDPLHNSGFANVYKNRGKIYLINNWFNSKMLGEKGYEKYKNRTFRYPFIDNETIIRTYLSKMKMSDKESITDIYDRYLNGRLDLKELTFPILKFKEYLEQYGICEEEFERAKNIGIININTSLEEVYQKILR